MTVTRLFAVDDGRDLGELADGLAARATFAHRRERVVERTVYDTFDWRLRRSGSVLEHETEVAGPAPRGGMPEPWLVWRSVDTAEVLGRIRVDAVPSFVWELPSGPTTDRLAAVLEMRALLELVTVRSRLVSLDLVGSEDKVEARLVIDQGVLVGGPRDGCPLTTVVEVAPVRGYERAAERVAELLAAQVVLRPATGDAVDQALVAVGRPPCSYSSKLAISLEPDTIAHDAYVAILAALFDTMLANEAGTRANTDSEFLHDFRVAVRRTRSILGMASGVLDPDLRDYLRDEFKWLGDITTPTRDLDVYLLDFGAFTSGAKVARQDDLEPLHSFLLARQRRAHAELVDALGSARYAQLVERHRSWLADGGSHDPAVGLPGLAPDAGRPAREVAAGRTWSAYRRFVRDARRIRPSSPPTQLHDLRKDAKKLRYALECFGSLFPRDEIAASVRELKAVQDVLGTFQDCEVQKSSLEGFGREMIAERGPSQAAALLAMGAIVEQLDDREARARAEFADRFARFDHRHVRARFRRLFAHAGHGHEA